MAANSEQDPGFKNSRGRKTKLHLLEHRSALLSMYLYQNNFPYWMFVIVSWTHFHHTAVHARIQYYLVQWTCSELSQRVEWAFQWPDSKLALQLAVSKPFAAHGPFYSAFMDTVRIDYSISHKSKFNRKNMTCRFFSYSTAGLISRLINDFELDKEGITQCQNKQTKSMTWPSTEAQDRTKKKAKTFFLPPSTLLTAFTTQMELWETLKAFKTRHLRLQK